MTTVAIAPLSLENFSIAPTWDGNTLRIAFAGNADMDARPALEAFVKSLNVQVLAAKLQRVVCDMRDLYFMNSACFKCLVQWIDAIVKSDVDQQYSLNFIKNPKMSSQARSLESLRHFGPAIVHIKTEA
jgi:hypothetical protein